jgi:hypothetical protein
MEPEFDQSMKTRDMIDVKMTDEKENRLILGYIPICFCDSVSRVEDDIIVFRLDEGRARVAGHRIIPPVRPEEGYLHGQDIGIPMAKRFR